MDRQNVKNLEMFTRVVEFGATHVELFPKNTLAGRCFAELGAAISNVSEHAAMQLASDNAISSNGKVRAAARESLRRQLLQIRDTASAIAIDTPGLKGRFRMPRENRDQHLIHAAKAFADAAEPLRKAFVQLRVPEDFLESLNAAAAQLERSILEHGSSKTKRVNANAAIRECIAQCFKVLTRVDAVVENTLVDDGPLLAEWSTTRHVVRVPTRVAASDVSKTPVPQA